MYRNLRISLDLNQILRTGAGQGKKRNFEHGTTDNPAIEPFSSGLGSPEILAGTLKNQSLQSNDTHPAGR